MSGNGKRHRHETYPIYAATPGVNWSTLRAMGQSPAHYHYRLTHPVVATPAMNLGRLLHTAVLEPDALPLEYAVFDGARRAGEVWEQFAAANAGKTIVKAEEYNLALDVRDAVRRHKAARRLLRFGRAEVTLRWVDERTHVRCKARLDWLCGDVFVDLKSTRDAEPRAFGRTFERLAYHGQFAFYRRGLIACGHRPADVYAIAVESEAPHDVMVYQVDEDVLAAGDLLVHDYLHRVRQCRSNRRWPGRDQGVQSLEFPAWALPSTGAYADMIEVLT